MRPGDGNRCGPGVERVSQSAQVSRERGAHSLLVRAGRLRGQASLRRLLEQSLCVMAGLRAEHDWRRNHGAAWC
jgi:hypothetical protein